MSDLKDRLAAKTGAVSTQVKPRTLNDQINALVPQMGMLVSADRAQRMARIALTEIKKTPKLAACDPVSILGCVMTATQLALEPGPLGHSYLVPFKGQCTLIIGYRGMLELVSRSERVDSIYAYAVYKGDIFSAPLGANPTVNHERGDSEQADAELTHVYAVAHIKSCAIPRIEVMTRKQVDAIRTRSQSGNNGPWVSDYAEMARKTVLKKLCKTLPLSAQSQEGILSDETVRLKLDMPPEPVYEAEWVDEGTGEVTQTAPCEFCKRTDGLHDTACPNFTA